MLSGEVRVRRPGDADGRPSGFQNPLDFLEHLIVVIRSLYDLLQKLSKRSSAKVVSLGEVKRRVIKELPDSFADIALKGGLARSENEIIQKLKNYLLISNGLLKSM